MQTIMNFCVTHNPFLKYLFWVALFLLVGARIGLSAIEYAYEDKVDLIMDFPSSSQVYDKNGVLLYEYFDQIRRIPISEEEIPPYLYYATLMAEDERFFRHAGFDPIGILRAFWKNMLAGQIEDYLFRKSAEQCFFAGCHHRPPIRCVSDCN